MRARWHVRANAVVLVWLLGAAAVAIGHRSVPQGRWLMVHLLLLGGASSAILIWSTHFAEALRRGPLPGGRPHLAVRLALHNVGALAVIAGLLADSRAAVVGGGVSVASAALWHGWCLWAQGRRQRLPSALGWTVGFYLAAVLALPVGVAFGVLLADGTRTATGHARVYVAHVIVMLLGWVGLTVVGTLVSLWPTMLRTRIADHRVAARSGLPVLLGALALMLAGAGTGARSGATVGFLVYVAGLGVMAGPLLQEARVRRPVGFAPWSVAAAYLWLVGTVLTQAVLVGTAADWPGAAGRLGGTIAPLVVGFAAQVLLGSLTHLAPVVLGGGPTVSRQVGGLVQSGAGPRVVLVNGGLLLYLLPAPGSVRVVASVVVLATMLVTPVLLIRGALLARRAKAPRAGPPPRPR